MKTSISLYSLIALLAVGLLGGNESARAQVPKFGVHDVVLTGNGAVENPFDTVASVTFTPPSGDAKAMTVQAFYDGGDTWRARIYASEAGEWRWVSACESDAGLGGKRGVFAVSDSKLPGRLMPHPKNNRQWITENGQWFLHLNDTAYFLLCAHDGNGKEVTDEEARRYVRDDVARGITSVRCFLASPREGFNDSRGQWMSWFFTDASLGQLRLDNLQCTDRRLRMLLDTHPEVAVQLILFPLEGYQRDDRFWTAMTLVQRERLLRQLIARFAAYPQLFWLITNDAHYGEKFPRSNAMAREVGAYLQKHDRWQHPRSTGHARRVPFYFGDEAWATYIHIEHAHDLGAEQYAPYDCFNKPVFLGEDRYEHDHAKLDPLHMRYWQRHLFWSWLLSGGSANYGGRWWAVQPYSETAGQPTAFHERSQVMFDKALTGLDSVAFIRDYFARRHLELSDFVPDHALVRDGAGSKAAHAPKLMRRGQEEFLIYHPNGIGEGREAHTSAKATPAMALDLSAASGSFTTEWYRCEDGESKSGDGVNGGSQAQLVSPWGGQDVVLRLVRQ